MDTSMEYYSRKDILSSLSTVNYKEITMNKIINPAKIEGFFYAPPALLDDRDGKYLRDSISVNLI